MLYLANERLFHPTDSILNSNIGNSLLVKTSLPLRINSNPSSRVIHYIKNLNLDHQGSLAQPFYDAEILLTADRLQNTLTALPNSIQSNNSIISLCIKQYFLRKRYYIMLLRWVSLFSRVWPTMKSQRMTILKISDWPHSTESSSVAFCQSKGSLHCKVSRMAKTFAGGYIITSFMRCSSFNKMQ